jgi:hypothetical protein
MTLGSSMRLFLLPVAVAITVLGYSGTASAADQPAIAAGPAMVGAPAAGCATCNATPANCNTCGNANKSIFHRTKTCTPYQTHLCPGQCFGYFQTQWHRWENVCPIPYQGVGLTDAPVRAGPATNIPPAAAPKNTGSDVPVPKGLPTIPTTPGK